ncbi:MAG: hypothetical protein RSC29_07230, partial [Oscillospiraceae bacterium]
INEGVRIDKNIIIEGGENGFIVSRDKLSLYGDVVFRNIRFQFSGTESDKRKIYVNGNNLTMDNVTIPEKTSEGIEIKIFPTIYGGGINPTNKNATINLNSGVFENIYAGSDVSTYSGNVDINFSGRAKISAPVGFVNGIDGGNVNGDVNISVSNMNNEVKHFKGGTGSGNKKITFNNYGNGPVSPYILRDFNDVVLGSNVYLAKKDSTQDFGNISNLTVSQSSTLEVSDDFSIAGNFIGGGIVKIAKVKKLNIGGKVFGETEFKMQLNDEEPTVNTAYITANGGGDGTFLYAKPIGTSFTGTGLVKSDGIPTTWKVGEYARTITKSEFNGAKTIDASSPYQNERTYSLACFDQYNVKFFVPTEFKIKEAEYADKVKIIPVGLSVILEIGPYITLPATVTLEAIVTLPNGTF